MLVKPDGGLYKESFLPNRKLIEAKANGNPIPFFQRVDEGSLSFSLTLLIMDWDKRNNLRSIARWLYQPYHKPLRFETNSDLEIHGMFVDKSELSHNGLRDGFITLTFQASSPYIHSIPHKKVYSVYGSLTEQFYNNGDLPLKFKMTIENRIRGNVSITNDDNGDEFLLTDMFDGETIYAYCEHEYLISSLEERLVRYLGDKHNDVWLVIPPESKVNLTFIGNYNISLEYQYKYLTYDNELEW